MSTKRVRCPSCLTEVPSSGGKVASRCPGCGTKISADAANPSKPAKPRKIRKKPRKEHHFDWIGPVMSFTSALALFLLSLGVAGIVYLLTSNVGPGNYASGSGSQTMPTFPSSPPTNLVPPTTPTTKSEVSKPPEKAWKVKADPPPASVKPFEFTSAKGIPVYGNPVVAAFGGPFAVDTPLRGFNVDPNLQAKEEANVPIIDLRTGKVAGKLPKSVLRSAQAVLSEDGKLLATRPASLDQGGAMIEIWSTDIDQPPLHRAEKMTVLWMGFARPNEFVFQCGGPDQQVQVVDGSTGAKLHEIALPADLFPPIKGGFANYLVDPLHGAISPGRTFLALGASSGIVLIDLREGKVAGRIKFDIADGKAQYLGLTFSADGSQLIGLVGLGGKTKLMTWRMEDGTLVGTIEPPAKSWTGPPMAGAKPGTVLVPYFESHGGEKLTYGCQAFDQKGLTGPVIPASPICWLSDGKLLVTGPIKDAPPETPLPALLTNPKRDDPTVRAIYPLTVD